MKRLLCMLLALMMVFGSLFVLSACDEKDKDDKKEDSTDSTSATAPNVPEGYALYENDYVYFVYPEGWEKREISGIVILVDATTGNNITVAYEPKSDVYKNMDMDGFNKTLVPAWKQQGMTVADVKITSSIKNSAGYEMTRFTYKATQSGRTMDQVMLIVPTGEYNYVISVTEGKPVDGLVDAVFNSITPKK